MHILPHHNSFWLVGMSLGVIAIPTALLFVLFEIARFGLN